MLPCTACGADSSQGLSHCLAANMAGNTCFEKHRLPSGGNETKEAGWQRDTVDSGSGVRGGNAGKKRVHVHEKSKKISTRQYLHIEQWRGLVREVLSSPRQSTETCSARSHFRDGRQTSACRVGRDCSGAKQKSVAGKWRGTGTTVH